MDGFFGNNSLLWIILLLCCCGNNGCGCGDACGCGTQGGGFGGMLPLLLLCLCGGFGGGFGCGCGPSASVTSVTPIFTSSECPEKAFFLYRGGRTAMDAQERTWAFVRPGYPAEPRCAKSGARRQRQ
jgi:hypothetical protein